MSEIQEAHDAMPMRPLPSADLIRILSTVTPLYPVFVVANRKLETQREELSTLRTKVSEAIKEADSIFTNFCSFLNTSAITGFIAFISVKTILSCITLETSVALAVALLFTIISPLFLAIRRFKLVFYDLDELERQQRILLQTTEKSRKYFDDLVKFVEIDLSTEPLGTEYFEGVDRLIVQLKLVLGVDSSSRRWWKVWNTVTRYPTLYRSTMGSACVALLIYVGTVYYLSNWEACGKDKTVYIYPVIKLRSDI